MLTARGTRVTLVETIVDVVVTVWVVVEETIARLVYVEVRTEDCVRETVAVLVLHVWCGG